MHREDTHGAAAAVASPRRADSVGRRPAATGVVVGVDGSLGVLGVAAWAGAEAARRAVGLHLVQVLPSSGEAAAGPEVPRGRARALLHRAMGAVSLVVPEVAVSSATLHGSVGPALVSYAARAELLVVGTHRPGGPLPLMAGRALAHLSAYATCPVVAVPPRWAGSWPSTPSPRPVVVGVDSSTDGERALRFAAESAGRLGVPLIALTARHRSRDGYDHDDDHDRDAQRERIAAQLARCRERHPGVEIDHRTVEGTAAMSLLHAARRAQLVVVGSRGCRAAGGALLGSTGQTLLRESPCAVAMLAPRHGEGRSR